MANFFMLGNTLLDFLVMALGFGLVVNFGFVNWAIRVPGIRVTLVSSMVSMAHTSANLFMFIMADFFGHIFTFGRLFLGFASFLDGLVDGFASTSGFFRWVGGWCMVSVGGAAVTIPPGFGRTYGDKNS